MRTSYWFVPSLLAAGALVLSFALPSLDDWIEASGWPLPGWIVTTTETARATLSALAGAMFAVMGTVFSITVVTLSLASQQFGPRLLRGFMYGLTTQITLGLFLASGFYCLLVLRVVEGDFVECGAIRGRIENITIRTSMIRQVDGQLVIVPNALLFKNPVDVLTSQPARRTTVICGVAYDTDLDKASDVIRQAVEECSTVRKEKPVEVFAQEFAASSINFEVTWWAGATPREQRESRDQVVRALKRALDGAGIEIPFPQQTLWLPQPIRTESA